MNLALALIMSTDRIFVIDTKSVPDLQKSRRRRSIIHGFGLNTSAHGIPGIARSQSISNTIFWSICFLAFTGICVYFVVREIRNYFDYSTQTSISLVSEWPQYFPAFTICNLAPVRYDRFIKPFLNFTATLNISDNNDTTTISLLQAKYLGDFFQTRINRNESISEFFFPLETMLIKCVFNGRSCSAVNFTSFSSSAYGFCYTFNGKLKNDTYIRYSDEFGGSGNLNLRFYVHSHQYVPYIREGVGMIAMVHDNAEWPLIDYSGMALATGFKHRMTYTKQTITYLRSPYSTCNDQIPPMMQAMFDNYDKVDYEYSEDVCYELCTQVYTYHECGCIDPLQWNARSVFPFNGNQMLVAPLCNISDKCYSRASHVFLTSSELMAKYCPYCSSECSITNFNIEPSMWKTPPTWLLGDIKHFVETSDIPLPNDWSTNWNSHIDSSYLAIELIQQSNIVESYTQTATTTAVDTLSNVGGQTGLWIGVSFLSIMELAEMLYRLLRHQFNTLRRNNRERNV